MKKMAIILYGHLRTYNDTHESFFKNVYEQINKHFDIDIYFHTWSKFEYFNSWHRGNLTFVNKKVDNNEVEKLKQIYKPIKFLVEEQKDGENMLSSFNRAKDLIDSPDRYDYFLITRFDIIFFTPFKLNFFVEAYNKHPLLKRFPLPKKWVMHGSNLLTWVPTADPRCLHTEAELFWISNFYPNSLYNNCIYIPIKYRLFFDYNICRSRETSNDFFIIDDSIHYRADGCLYGKKKLVEVIFDKLENSNNTFNLAIKEKDQIINSKTNQINQLQNNAQEKSTQLNQIQSKLSFQTKYGTAKTRIQNQLSYKLGQAMIINSKSILGYIRMPFVLSYIKDKHKQEQKIYQEKIKKDPSLKLPILEDYPDYKEALKLKNHLSYKLGQALIQANKTWYKGGYVKMLFEIGKLKRD